MSNEEVAHLDHSEWPSLNGSTEPLPPPPPPPDSDWELLDETHINNTSYQHVVIVPNSKLLRHSASSPDFRRLILHDVAEETNEDDDDNDASSYGMVSGPASVVSLASGLSFRDAILLAAPPEHKRADSGILMMNARKSKRRVTPKFVVKPIQRCTKSTGDLKSLVSVQEHDEFLGDTDAMDFYHRKALGAKGYVNAAKMRPDEAKRLAITMHKKDLQRQANASRGG